MEAAIFDCQCDQMQNCEGGCETIYMTRLHRPTSPVDNSQLDGIDPWCCQSEEGVVGRWVDVKTEHGPACVAQLVIHVTSLQVVNLHVEYFDPRTTVRPVEEKWLERGILRTKLLLIIVDQHVKITL